MPGGKASKRRRTEEPRRPPAPRAGAAPGVDRRLWVALAVAAAVLVALVAGVLLTRGEDDGDTGAGGTLPDAAEVVALYEGIPQAGVALGADDAPVTVVEFVDLQCPFCRDFEVDAAPGLVRGRIRSGDARLELRTLAFLGPDSERGARAVLAAGLQGKAHQLKALLFANQGAENAGWLSDDLVAAAGRSIAGLDVERLVEDMDGSEVDALLAEAAQDAERLGVNSTPTVLVGETGGELQPVQLQSPGDLAAVEAAIDAASG